MKRSLSFRPFFYPLTAAAAFFVLLLCTPAQALNRVWSNTGTDYNTPANWNGGNAPGADDAATFSDATPSFQPNLSSPVTNLNISFSTSGWTLSGSALSLTSTGTNTLHSTGAAIVTTNASGINTISAPIILGQPLDTTATFRQTPSGTLVISGDISSTNAITGLSLVNNNNSPTATFTLSGNNTYNGTTTIGRDVHLNINSATAISSGNLVVSGSSGVSIDNTSAAPISLSNNNLNLSGGSLTFVGTNDLSFGSGTVTISGGNRTITTTAGTLTVGGIVADTALRTLVKAGDGTLVVTGNALDFQGGTTISGGMLRVGNGGTAGNLGTGSVANNAALVFNRSDSFTFANTITGTGSVTKLGNTTLTLSSASPNTFSGGLIISAGSVVAATGSAVRAFGDGNVSMANNTTLDLNGGSRTVQSGHLATSGNGTGVVVTSGAAGAVTLTLGGTTNGTFAGTINNGSGTVGVTITGQQTFSGSSSYTGITRVEGASAVLEVTELANGGVNSPIGAATSDGTNLVLFGGATLRYAGTGNNTDRLFQIWNLSGGTLDSSGAGPINFTNTGDIAFSNITHARILTLTGSNEGTSTLAPNLKNSNVGTGITGLTKSGAGKWVLEGANTYAGQTLISAGTLLINGSHVDGTTSGTTTGFGDPATGHFQVASSAIFGGSGNIGGNDKGAANSNLVLVESGGFLAPGASIGTLTLDGVNITGTDSSVLNMAAGSQFNFELSGDGLTADSVDFWNYVAGDFALNFNILNLSLSGAPSFGTYTVDIFRFFSNNGTSLTASGISGGLTLTGATIDSNISNPSILYGTDVIQLQYTVIPEPRTWALLGIGLAAVVFRLRHRR